MNPFVSIIVLNHKGGKVTEACLNSVFKTKYPNFEILLVDNGSSKKEVDQIRKKFYKKIRLIFNKKNLGYAGGNNLGARNAKGKYLVFLNNDTLVSPNWLMRAVNRLERDLEIAFLQPKIKWLKYKNFFEYAGGAGGYLDFFGYPFVRGRIFGTIEEDVGQYDDEHEIFWASGVAFFARKEIFTRLGGFDESFFAYAEENDLCFRAHRAGYKVLYFPRAEVWHFGGFTSNQNMGQKIFLIHRNHLALLLKNYKKRELALIIPVRFLMDCGTIIYYLLTFKSTNSAWAVARAYFSLLVSLPTLIKRRLNDEIGNFGYYQPNLRYTHSVVWSYFFSKKQRFSEIFNDKKKYEFHTFRHCEPIGRGNLIDKDCFVVPPRNDGHKIRKNQSQIKRLF